LLHVTGGACISNTGSVYNEHHDMHVEKLDDEPIWILEVL